MTLNDYVNNLVPYLLLCCVLPTVVMVGLMVWAVYRGAKLLQPEEGELLRRFEGLKAANPGLKDDELVNKIIQRQAMRAGIVGAITSVGGLPLLPIGLPIDLITTARLQTETLHFIAWAYGGKGNNQQVLDLNQALALRFGVSAHDMVVMGSQQVSQRVVRRLLVMIAEKAAAKLVPFIGLAIGFAVNYALARGTSHLAARWYKSRLAQT